jgi:hypothetical protein
MARRSVFAETAARLAGLAAVQAAARRAAAGGSAGAGRAPGAPPGGGRFDRAIDALNRLPRPAFAFGALALFGYGLVDPAGFARRMAAFAAVPEPLWWLLGAVVGFYFGARELHHFRGAREAAEDAAAAARAPAPAAEADLHTVKAARPSRGPARSAARSA